MLNDATLKNVPKSVEDAILQANHPTDMRLAMIDAMQRTGVLVPATRDQEFDPRLAVPQAPAVQSLPARPEQEPTCYRVLYLHGNDRLEIYGVSEAELDQKENQLRSMYGQG
jgi:hypothetical protein